MEFLKRNKKILITISILIILAIICAIAFGTLNNWKNKFQISEIKSDDLLDNNRNANMSGKIKNITNNEYSDVYVIIKYYTLLNSKTKYYIDKCYVGSLSYGEEKTWHSSISEEQRKKLLMYDEKVEKVEYIKK